MNVKCGLGLHDWQGCKCSACGKRRDQGHEWSADSPACTRCGEPRPPGLQSPPRQEAARTPPEPPSPPPPPPAEMPPGPRRNPDVTPEYMARHDRITRVLVLDSVDTEGGTIPPVTTDAATGVSTALAGAGESIEFTGRAEGVGAIRTANGWAVLHHAVNANDAALLRRVLDLGLDVDVPDGKGWTPMHHAAWVGSAELVRVLREHGAALDPLSSRERLTPLHVAIVVDTAVAAEALLALGANPELASRDDLRPLHLAAMQDRAAIARLLLARGASVDALEANGSTALHAAAFTGHEDVVRVLLAAGADTGIVDAHGNTPRSLALLRDHVAVAALLPADPGAEVPDPDDASDLVDDGDDEMVAIEQLLLQLDEIARTGQPIISKSQGEHFDNIVPVMNLVGATRRGSQAVSGPDGRSYVLDLYTLPSGLELKAGYPD